MGEPCPPPPEDANSAGTKRVSKEPTPGDRAAPALSAAARGAAAEPAERGVPSGRGGESEMRRVGEAVG